MLRLTTIAQGQATIDRFRNNRDHFIDSADASYERRDYLVSALYYDSAFSVGLTSSGDYYNAACSNSLAGRTTNAVVLLNRAFETKSAYSGFNFEWMYYDKDLNPIRSDPEYQKFESKYRPDSTIYYFDIIRDLSKEDDVSYDNMKVIMTTSYFGDFIEGGLADYTFDDIRNRSNLKLNDTILDFSTKKIEFNNCTFDKQVFSANTNLLRNLLLKTATFFDCKGYIYLRDIKVDNLICFSDFDELVIDRVVQNGTLQMRNIGNHVKVKDSNFQISSESYRGKSEFADYGYFDLGFALEASDENRSIVIIDSVLIQKSNTSHSPAYLGFLIHADVLMVTKSKFDYPIKFMGNVTDRLQIHFNQFGSYMDISNIEFPENGYYLPYGQFQKEFTEMSLDIGTDNVRKYRMKGDSLKHYIDEPLFDKLVTSYKRLYNNYRNRGELASANASYVRLKELEITHLSQKGQITTEEHIRLRLNQLMGLYTDQGTSPGKAIIISFYITLGFGVFYFFFPSEWDKSAKTKLISDFRLFIEKNEHGYLRPFSEMTKGFLLSFLNALTLSVNAFVTLGFGSIPTSGLARYVCVLQGLLGWFLLSLFTVALINQVLL